MTTTTIIIATALISAIVFIPVGIFIRKKVAESKIQSAENEAKRLLENVKVEVESNGVLDSIESRGKNAISKKNK